MLCQVITRHCFTQYYTDIKFKAPEFSQDNMLIAQLIYNFKKGVLSNNLSLNNLILYRTHFYKSHNPSVPIPPIMHDFI